MITFESDYTEGAHIKILERLMETNLEPLSGYGEDRYSVSAKEKIKAACGCENADVFLLVGGTQTNKTVIGGMLDTYEGVVACDSGHISTHEAGAIENSGHKVLTLKGENGKLMPSVLKEYLETFFGDDNHDHAVFPGMVYISHPTEYGTLYTKSELTELSEICKEHKLPLYMDGARLGYAIASSGTDLSLSDIASLVDVFYIGGTKVGALCGEALVFPKGNAPKHFFTHIKQNGALLAKGRVLGVQFDTLFTDGLYFEISRHAIRMADRMREIFKEKGYRFFIETVTNQIFVILENTKMQQLKKSVAFGFWEKYDHSHTVVRFASSWATSESNVELLSNLL